MKTSISSLCLPLIAALVVSGCENKSSSNDKAKSTTEAAHVGENEWCAEHGVPEAICTRCTKSLIAGFKQKGDWCNAHQLPKSQCIDCDPALKTRFEAMAPKK